MTNKEVINFLDQVRKILLDDKSWLESTIQPINEAFNMAISALTAQSETHSCDLIDRRALMKEFSDFVRASNNSDFTPKPTWNDAVSLVKSMPPVQPSSSCAHENDQDLQPICNQLATDCISRQAAIDYFVNGVSFPDEDGHPIEDSDELRKIWTKCFDGIPSAQPDIKQAAKLLSDFIESCPGGDSYLITPDGEELRTDWGYAMEGIQLIHEWAERKTDGGRD